MELDYDKSETWTFFTRATMIHVRTRVIRAEETTRTIAQKSLQRLEDSKPTNTTSNFSVCYKELSAIVFRF